MHIDTATPTRQRRALPALGEYGSYALAIVLVCSPGLLHARTQIFGAGDDARYYTWLGWRMGRLIAHGHVIPLRIGDVIHPFGLDLRLLDGYLPSYVSGLFNLVMGPTLAYNLTFVVGAMCNIAAARALGRRLSSSRMVYTIAAVAFLTAPPIAVNVQQGLLPLFWAFTVPLLVADALDVGVDDHTVRPLRLALLLTVAYLCSVYFLVFGGLAYGVIVGVAALRRRNWQMVLATAGAVALTFILLLPFIVPRIRFDRAEAKRGGDTELLADSNVFSADALSILAQPTRSTFLLPRPDSIKQSIVRLPDTRFALETSVFPGLFLLAGFVVFLCARDRRRLPLALAAGMLWVAGLGPSLKFAGNVVWSNPGGPVSWLPYRLLLAVPGLGGLRVPVRTGEVLVTVLVAATTIALARVLAAGRVRAVVLGAGSVVLLATNLLVPLPTTTMGVTDASRRAFREIARVARPGDTVLRVPSDCDPSFASLQILHHAAVVGCTGSFAANPWSKLVVDARSEALAKLRCDRTHYGRIVTPETTPRPFGPQDVEALRSQFGVRFLVIDRTLVPGCPALAASLPVLEQYRSLGGDGRYEVIDLSAPAGRRLSSS